MHTVFDCQHECKAVILPNADFTLVRKSGYYHKLPRRTPRISKRIAGHKHQRVAIHSGQTPVCGILVYHGFRHDIGCSAPVRVSEDDFIASLYLFKRAQVLSVAVAKNDAHATFPRQGAIRHPAGGFVQCGFVHITRYGDFLAANGEDAQAPACCDELLRFGLLRCGGFGRDRRRLFRLHLHAPGHIRRGAGGHDTRCAQGIPGAERNDNLHNDELHRHAFYGSAVYQLAAGRLRSADGGGARRDAADAAVRPAGHLRLCDSRRCGPHSLLLPLQHLQGLPAKGGGFQHDCLQIQRLRGGEVLPLQLPHIRHDSGAGRQRRNTRHTVLPHKRLCRGLRL